MPFRSNSSELSKNNARNIIYMPALILRKFFDFEQVSADSEMPILERAPSTLTEILLFVRNIYYAFRIFTVFQTVHK